MCGCILASSSVRAIYNHFGIFKRLTICFIVSVDINNKDLLEEGKGSGKEKVSTLGPILFIDINVSYDVVQPLYFIRVLIFFHPFY